MRTTTPFNAPLKLAAIFLALTATTVPVRCADTNTVQQVSLQTTLSGQRTETTVAATTRSALSQPSPFAIKGRRVTSCGVIVQAIKANHPLQPLNPFAPEEYGNGQANLVRDPITRRANGIALVSIRF